ncbi:UDP-4-amino-4,6-dideoxy-N-acetyl-beta-L-altrosamine transaminase [Marinilabilia rubra]|uniref:UDP-4-amino-4, 6-dideoxy-N-acetyl-beta-L-altrosamine transaminase n=1 Tax=Marinilabilia rubra TaxID=2162893 RepID=A0A2U2B3P2_9BACT|nr:UDP-4-amino-4,6-dideoxy-N-acetyl-beta-L-altrosamine transaminase [Marinilabilia rubra]PWD97679.1 UDP-4-amino-4,6-dideoxy-N-acetyl-beta-L-altrosamine transaminase [Marinilabilia rubra]
MIDRAIPYGKQSIDQKDIDAVVNVLKSDFLTQGPAVSDFEKAFAKYIGAKFAIAVSNGTAALHLSALALGVSEGDKVITTPITFAASANCIRYAGGEVVFADIDPESYLIDLNEVKKLLSESPKGTFKGIIPVDFAGRAVNMESLREIADQYGCWIIEDACHAPGGWFTDSKGIKQFCGNGNFADLAIFSFHPVKHIASGEGGMITTNDEELYNKLLVLRTHGITKDANLLEENHGGWYYEMQQLGYNYRLSDIQAALGASQLRKADEGLQRRRKIAKRYNQAFKEVSQIKGQSGYVEGHAYHLFIIEVEDRLGLYNFLRKNGVFAQVHYIPVHLMPYYKQLGWKKGDMRFAENYYSQCLSLPMYPSLSDEEQEFVINCIFDFFA